MINKYLTAESMRPNASRSLWLAWLVVTAAGTVAWLGELTQDYLPYAVCALVLDLSAAGVALAALRSSTFVERLQTLTIALIDLVASALSLSVIGEITRPADGKLALLHYAGYQGVPDVFPSYVLLLALLGAGSVPIPLANLVYVSRAARTFSESQAASLLGLGAVGLVLTLSVSRSNAFGTRGSDNSQGAVTLAYWAAAVGVSYTLAAGGSLRRTPLVVGAAVAETIGLLFSANRTPLILIACALLYRTVADRPRVVMAAVPAAAVLGLFTASYLSLWRGQVRDGLSSDPGTVMKLMTVDPVGAFLNIGIDSVDGYFLAGHLIRLGFDPQPLDPLIAVLNFVPRALWESKPVLLGSRIGVDYLGFSSGGIFLSGPGYLALVTGSVVLGAVLFIIVVLLTRSLIVRRADNPVWPVSGLFFCLTFAVAGDAFNLFLALQVAVLWAGSGLLAAVASRISPRTGGELRDVR